VLYVAPNEVGQARIGISVNRRVGKAVVRNRVRRRIREAVRPVLAQLPDRDLVFIARAPSASADWAGLRGAALELLRRARLVPTPAPATGR
jgi:ribonuclease P protein component